jgi:hypothetical protein
MRWKQHELELLTEMRQAGATNPEIARALHRSVQSVRTKALDQHLPSHYRPTPPTQPPRNGRSHLAKHPPRAGKTTLPPLASLHDS